MLLLGFGYAITHISKLFIKLVYKICFITKQIFTLPINKALVALPKFSEHFEIVEKKL